MKNKKIIVVAILIALAAYIFHTLPSKADVAIVEECDDVVVEELVEVEPVVEEKVYIADEEDVILIAKTLYGECRGIPSDMEKAAVAWCILNRVDADGYGTTVREVVTAPKQFVGYRKNNPVTDELKALAEDVLIRWYREHDGEEYVGRVLPKEYVYFHGKNNRNWFRKEFRSKQYWDWSLENVYAS